MIGTLAYATIPYPQLLLGYGWLALPNIIQIYNNVQWDWQYNAE